MDPQYEQRLRDEVLFLHSLWHQGPPTPTPTPYHLHPSKSTHFKRNRAKTRNTPPIPTPSPGLEWPCPASPPPAATWPTAPANPPPPLSSEEQSKLAAKRALHRALKAVRESLIRSNNGPDSDSDSDSDEIESSDDDDGEPIDGNCGREGYSVFSEVLEDAALKEYYAKNFVLGEFSCLVCGAVGGRNSGKKFKGCLPLLQHSISIEKTKRRGAHRAFAQAVCEVLGWDIHRLSEIGSKLSEKSGDLQQGNCDGDKVESSVALAHNADSVNDDASGGKGIGVVDMLLDTEEPALDGLTSGNGDGDKVESSVALAHSVDSAKDDALDGKDGEAELASNAGEDIGSVHTLPGTEEPSSDGLTSCF